MIFDFEKVYFFIIAASVGIAVAVLYTNIQRSAIGKFVYSLLYKCNDDENPFTLDELGIKGINALIVKRAVKTHNGLRKAVDMKIGCTDESIDDAKKMLYGKRSIYKFTLKNDADKELLKERYSFKSTSPLKTFAILLLVIVTAFTAIKITDIFSGYLSAKQLSSKNEDSDSDNNFEIDNDYNNFAEEKNITENKKNIDNDDTVISTPSIPTLPQKKENE